MKKKPKLDCVNSAGQSGSLYEKLLKSIQSLQKILSRQKKYIERLDQRYSLALGRIEYYLRVVNSIHDGYLVHENGIIKEVNESMTAITGYEAHEIIGFPFTKFVTGEHARVVNEHLTGEVSGTYEIETCRKDGTRIIIELSGSHIEGEQGRVVIIRDVTRKKLIEQVMREREELFRLFTEQEIIGIYTIVDGKISYFNEMVLKITGYTPEDVKGWDYEGFMNIIHPDDRQFVLQQIRRKMRGETGNIVKQYDFRIFTKRGKIKWVTLYSAPVVYDNNIAVMSAMLDISERKNAENKIRESEERFRILAESPFQGLFIHDDIGIIFANSAFFKMIGLDQNNPRDLEKVYGVNALTFISPEYHKKIMEDIRYNNNEAYEVRALRHNYTPFYAELQSSIAIVNGKKMRVFAVRDITERKKNEFNLTHDLLTGLLNEQGFIAYLGDSIRRQTGFDVLEIEINGDDLNKIRNINVDDEYKTIGNELEEFILSDIANNINRYVFPGNVIARSGNRFYILIPSYFGSEYASTDAINRAMSLFPFRLHGFPNEVDAIVGITSYPQDFDGSNPMKILNNCDSAVRWARDKGDRFMIYNKKRDREFRATYRLEQDLRIAVERMQNESTEEFYLEYQPKVNVREDVIGFEALLRWKHPSQGNIAPSTFILIAEQNGLIHDLGKWAISQACSVLREWQKINPMLTLSVNISPSQLNQDFITFMRNAIRASGITTEGLELEIVEREIVKDENARILEMLHGLGISISVDDFTDERAGLRQIAGLTDIISTLKFSPSAINYVMENNNYSFIVKGIIEIAHRYPKYVKMVAEGIDSKEKFDRCIMLGFDYLQGFYKNREPKSYEDATRLVLMR